MSAGRTDRTLSIHLCRCEPLTEEVASWFDGRVRLRLRGYLADRLPPLEFITSSRCLIFRQDMVLVQRDKDSTHILPGGRREAEESLEETLRREVLEETGWALADPKLIGFVHFCHLTPKPLEYAYPYPDFVQVVYMANAMAFIPGARLDDGHEVESVFRSIAEVRSLTLPASQRLFLDAALRLRGSLS